MRQCGWVLWVLLWLWLFVGWCWVGWSSEWLLVIYKQGNKAHSWDLVQRSYRYVGREHRRVFLYLPELHLDPAG